MLYISKTLLKMVKCHFIKALNHNLKRLQMQEINMHKPALAV